MKEKKRQNMMRLLLPPNSAQAALDHALACTGAAGIDWAVSR